jgi:hypothetical protein
MNPWQPPVGWDKPPGRDGIGPAPAEGPWTVGRILGAMGRAIAGQPLGLLLAVFVIPGIWMVPTTPPASGRRSSPMPGARFGKVWPRVG